MLVTCICVCHNKPDLTHEAIQSIVNQSYHDWELIIVDSGVLYDAGYYDKFNWINDQRIKLVRSDETEEIRNTKAMAPWCFNECFRKGLVKGELCLYLSDDDIYYPNAFETYVSYCKHNPNAKAMYASQDIGVIYPNGWRAIVGERKALVCKGSCLGRADNLRLDCVVDGMQLCHYTDIVKDPWWPEGKDTECHADGVLLEKIGSQMPIYPIDIKTSQNRRTPNSKYGPSK